MAAAPICTVLAPPRRDGRWMLPLLLVLGLAATPVALQAADSAPTSTAAAADPLAQVRAHIAARRWPASITELQRLNAVNSADWHNLMGYCLRKGDTPDLIGAGRHYREALRIDPAHRGALEYSGELALMLNDLPAAEQSLARLNKVCTFGCEEYTDLKQALQRYKATGKRWTAK